MAFWDRLIARQRTCGWGRRLAIQVPVYEHQQFQRSPMAAALLDAAWFLTGDKWSFDFVARKGPRPVRQGNIPFGKGTIRHIVPFSDGLDSFAQVRLSEHEHGRDAVMLVRADSVAIRFSLAILASACLAGLAARAYGK